MKNKIYLDNAATTKMHEDTINVMKPFWCEHFHNPSSLYDEAIYCKKRIAMARNSLAEMLGADQNEIYFTSGGTEANNWAVKGIADTYGHKGKHIITSKIEHPSVLNTCKSLEAHGYELTYLDVDKEGFIRLDQLENSIRQDTIGISIMYANNEVGTLLQIGEIGEIAQKHHIIFHTDAVQAFGHVRLNIKKLNISMLSASAHKFHGPKGIGFLYIQNKVMMNPYFHGGKQEFSHRAGTENVAGIVAMEYAAHKAYEDLDGRNERLVQMRKQLIHRICTAISEVKVNGSLVSRLSNHISLCFKGISGLQLVNWLGKYGICVSSGSACHGDDITPSHVLSAMDVGEQWIHGALRISFDESLTKNEIDYLIDSLHMVVSELRELNGYHCA